MGKVFRKTKELGEKIYRETGQPLVAVSKSSGKSYAVGAPQSSLDETSSSAVAAAAAPVSVPEAEKTTDESQTESGRKKARSGGKKSLSVSRKSGGGINI